MNRLIKSLFSPFVVVVFIAATAVVATSARATNKTTSLCPSIVESTAVLPRETPFFSTLPNRDLNLIELRRWAIKTNTKYKEEIRQAIHSATKGPDGRTYAKFFENENVTIWAILWDNDATEIHDHVNSQAAVSVIEGTITEEFFSPPNPRATVHQYKAGKTFTLGGLPYVHRISGHGITLHIYSPKLAEMTHYDFNSAGLLVPKGRWSDRTP